MPGSTPNRGYPFPLPTDTINVPRDIQALATAIDTDAAFLSGVLKGAGSPEGVVAAPPGSKYIDTAATNGAIEWIKAVDVGVTGWRVVYGDTGLRALATWTTAGVVTGTPLSASFVPRAGNAGGYYFRRINETILFVIYNVQTAVALVSGTGYDLFPLSSAVQTDIGLRTPGPPFYSSYRPLAAASGSIKKWANGASTALVVPDAAVTLGTAVFNANETVLTAVAAGAVPWPTNLPGIAAAALDSPPAEDEE